MSREMKRKGEKSVELDTFGREGAVVAVKFWAGPPPLTHQNDKSAHSPTPQSVRLLSAAAFLSLLEPSPPLTERYYPWAKVFCASVVSGLGGSWIVSTAIGK
ncbi:hypothetical protein Ddc_01673 [Ditylenchus destructor]|nr:hypothetical protein Ddc_01673 [Ditylenchus destructor]